MKRIVVFTGAGISRESGLQTFRDSDGLWEGYRIEEVATPEAWQRDPDKVQEFYNLRRKGVLEAEPNAAHRALVELEAAFKVQVITQNIDDLHERAGSTSVLHLHGEVCFARSTKDPERVYPIEGWELRMGELCELGSQLRPHIVWFGEAVPMMDQAIEIAGKADIFVVIGSSLVVYPAAGLVDCAPSGCSKFLVDPVIPGNIDRARVHCIEEAASVGVPRLVEQLLAGDAS